MKTPGLVSRPSTELASDLRIPRHCSFNSRRKRNGIDLHTPLFSQTSCIPRRTYYHIKLLVLYLRAILVSLLSWTSTWASERAKINDGTRHSFCEPSEACSRYHNVESYCWLEYWGSQISNHQGMADAVDMTGNLVEGSKFLLFRSFQWKFCPRHRFTRIHLSRP